ncbi:MAG: copper homeostasis protein CutC, partial [Cyclobacteriaceae bacterium]|nr:copper homeostasis protein CutC [Cyclobacteriaceae bacterium]
KIILEVIAGSVEDARSAYLGGADRIELCVALNEGGITPSPAVIEEVIKSVDIPVFVMIRPRGGSFTYTEEEIKIMERDIQFVKNCGGAGVVIGVITDGGKIDTENLKKLIAAAKPMQVTFHRAFDVLNDPEKEINQLIEWGVDRILTSGGEKTAFQGKERIKRIVEKAGKKIIILPGSGINADNVKEIVEYTGVSEIHISGKSTVAPPKYFSTGMFESEDYITNKEIVTEVRRKINQD